MRTQKRDKGFRVLKVLGLRLQTVESAVPSLQAARMVVRLDQDWLAQGVTPSYAILRISDNQIIDVIRGSSRGRRYPVATPALTLPGLKQVQRPIVEDEKRLAA